MNLFLKYHLWLRHKSAIFYECRVCNKYVILLAQNVSIKENMMQTVYPWQVQQWQTLQARRKSDQLAHAYLLTGARGLGKQDFIFLLAKSLFCQAPTIEGYACHHCSACHLFAANSHPDWHPVFPEESAKGIKIEQIRELVDYSYQTAQLGGYKIIVINPADSMNNAAANALLKTLEEPGKKTILFLIAEDASRLPITVRSRCQLLKFNLSETQGLAWLKEALPDCKTDYSLLLKLAQGAPLQAVHIAQSEELAERQAWFKNWYQWTIKKSGLMEAMLCWQKVDVAPLLSHMMTWVSDVLLIAGGAQEQQIINSDNYVALQRLSSKINAEKAYQYWDYLGQIKVWSNNNLNMTLLLEDLLLRWRLVLI